MPGLIKKNDLYLELVFPVYLVLNLFTMTTFCYVPDGGSAAAFALVVKMLRYLIYLISRPDYYADNENYQKIAHVAIEFYYDDPDPDLADQIEALIPTAYTVSKPEYLESETMYVTIFEMEVPLNAE